MKTFEVTLRIQLDPCDFDGRPLATVPPETNYVKGLADILRHHTMQRISITSGGQFYVIPTLTNIIAK